eukprot:m.16939 g.16939  ORF g.16939 m.16939 type:complete len:278 (+) comp3440_c1_seq1:121-954(+)
MASWTIAQTASVLRRVQAHTQSLPRLRPLIHHTMTTQGQAAIELHADKTQRAVVHTDTVEWTPSPSAGVFRRMIERQGGEVARASTIVRFDPNKQFGQHTHTGGEEYLVLDGVWRDDYGVYPVGTYVRNYIGSSHTPRIGEEGCTIFVKLRQMDLSVQEPETQRWDTSPNADGWVTLADGRRRLSLYASPNETVFMEQWPANLAVPVTLPKDGEELLVIEGDVSDTDVPYEDTVYRRRTWVRHPASMAGTVVRRVAGTDGALVWFKTNHLNSPEIGV